MVSFCGGLGFILHLVFFAQLLFIMDEQSVPVHSVPVSDSLASPAAVHVPSPVAETDCITATCPPTDIAVQEQDSEGPQRAQCIVKRFQKRSVTQPSPPLDQPALSPGGEIFQQTVDSFISGTDSACFQPVSPVGSLHPPSPSYDADFEWVDSIERNGACISSESISGAGSWQLLSGDSWPDPPAEVVAHEAELSPLRTGQLHFDVIPAGVLPFVSSATQGPAESTVHSVLHSSTVPATTASAGKPLARPASLRVGTSRAKSLHSHPVRTSQHARLRPVVHLKASFRNPVAGPKPRPVPSARGAYASYPSLTTSWGKQAEGAVSKSSPPVKVQDGVDAPFPLLSAARISGAATGYRLAEALHCFHSGDQLGFEQQGDQTFRCAFATLDTCITALV